LHPQPAVGSVLARRHHHILGHNQEAGLPPNAQNDVEVFHNNIALIEATQLLKQRPGYEQRLVTAAAHDAPETGAVAVEAQQRMPRVEPEPVAAGRVPLRHRRLNGSHVFGVNAHVGVHEIQDAAGGLPSAVVHLGGPTGLRRI